MSRDRFDGERRGGSGPGGAGRDGEVRGKDGHDAIEEAALSEGGLAPAREADALEARGLEAMVLEAMVATLEPEPLPVDGWEKLRAELGTGRGARHHALRSTSREPSVTSSPVVPPPAQRGTASATHWVVGMVLAAAVVVAGSWGALMAGEAAELRDDQRILAYWMANPDMRLVALSAPDAPAAALAAAPAAGPARLGVVCVLPDGRALLLQPAAAPRGATYVVRGGGPGGTRELVRGSGNMLQFDATGVQAVEVVVARGAGAAVVARAQLD